MKNIDIHGMTNMELIRGGIAEWYWATDYIHGDLYEAEELFRQKNSVQSNRLYLIHYPDGMVYEPVLPVDGQYLFIREKDLRFSIVAQMRLPEKKIM